MLPYHANRNEITHLKEGWNKIQAQNLKSRTKSVQKYAAEKAIHTKRWTKTPFQTTKKRHWSKSLEDEEWRLVHGRRCNEPPDLHSGTTSSFFRRKRSVAFITIINSICKRSDLSECVSSQNHYRLFFYLLATPQYPPLRVSPLEGTRRMVRQLCTGGSWDYSFSSFLLLILIITLFLVFLCQSLFSNQSDILFLL